MSELTFKSEACRKLAVSFRFEMTAVAQDHLDQVPPSNEP